MIVNLDPYARISSTLYVKQYANRKVSEVKNVADAAGNGFTLPPSIDLIDC